jgi:hypothetical protein
MHSFRHSGESRFSVHCFSYTTLDEDRGACGRKLGGGQRHAHVWLVDAWSGLKCATNPRLCQNTLDIQLGVNCIGILSKCSKRRGLRSVSGLVLIGLSFFVIIVCLLGWFTLERDRERIMAGIGENLKESLKTADDRKYIVTELERSEIVRDFELQTYGRNREIRDTLATFIRTEYGGQTGILGWLVDLSGLKEAEREMKARFDELARFRRLAIGREQRMIELKKEINKLLKATGLSEKYKIH